jgi:Flp pilus assembly protein TadG
MKRLRCDSGVVIMEAALVLPVFVLVSFVMIDIQWMLAHAQAIEYIVTETAHCEAMQGTACTAPNSATSYAQKLAANVHLDLRDDQISAPACNGSTCQLTVTYRYKQLGAWFPPFTITRTGMAAQAPELP